MAASDGIAAQTTPADEPAKTTQAKGRCVVQ